MWLANLKFQFQAQISWSNFDLVYIKSDEVIIGIVPQPRSKCPLSVMELDAKRFISTPSKMRKH